MGVVLTRESSHVIAERMTAKAVQAKAAATDDDRDRVASMVEKATRIEDPVDRVMEHVTMTPGMAAILWLDHNRYNRDWDAKVSAEYAAMMSADLWRITSQAVYALYKESGDVADGSHRLIAQVWADCSLDMFVCLGMSKDDVAALDCGKRRTPPDVCKLIGVAKAPEKHKLLKGLWNYLSKVNIATDRVSDANVNGVAMRIKEHDALLSRCLELGAATSVDATAPILPDDWAARLAVVLLSCGWDEDKVSDLLSEIQTEEFTSDNSPLFYAREEIQGHHVEHDVWGEPNKMAVVIKAMMMASDGVEITQSRKRQKIRELVAAAKDWPDPRQPGFDAE